MVCKVGLGPEHVPERPMLVKQWGPGQVIERPFLWSLNAYF